MPNETALSRHVIFCTSTTQNINQAGSQAELDTVQFLVDNLNPDIVGDFRILVNYNMPIRGGETREIDLLVINKFGLYLIDVKDWHGVIEAYANHWLLSGHKRKNAFDSIDMNAKVLHGERFGRGESLVDIGKVSVVGMVVLAGGKKSFINHCNHDNKRIVGIGPSLIQALAIHPVQHGKGNKQLTNRDIHHIQNELFRMHEEKKRVRIGNYEIVKELSPGKLFSAYEAINTFSKLHVRIKVFHLPSLYATSKKMIENYKRGAEAVDRMGGHQNILQHRNFFRDPDRPDTFYEVTEWIRGERLDGIMAQYEEPLPVMKQLDIIESLGAALKQAHGHDIFHRNLNPETVLITDDGVVKLADFDYAKIVDEATILDKAAVMEVKPTTPPELIKNPSAVYAESDIFSLGALWYLMASLPENDDALDRNKINKFDLPENAKKLMKQMVRQAIESRPESAEVVVKEISKIREEIQQ